MIGGSRKRWHNSKPGPGLDPTRPNRIDPESCANTREGIGEALTTTPSHGDAGGAVLVATASISGTPIRSDGWIGGAGARGATACRHPGQPTVVMATVQTSVVEAATEAPAGREQPDSWAGRVVQGASDAAGHRTAQGTVLTDRPAPMGLLGRPGRLAATERPRFGSLLSSTLLGSGRKPVATKTAS
jgi:hypothetical protein